MAQPDLIGNLCGHLFDTLLGGTVEETPRAGPFSRGHWVTFRRKKKIDEDEADDEGAQLSLILALLA